MVGDLGAPKIRKLRVFVGPCVATLATLAIAVAFLGTPPSLNRWLAPVDAMPSFSGQTGAPCAACHVGGFGPQLTPFGISFVANGYTLGGGEGPWAHIPVSVEVTPSLQHTGTALPAAPDGYGNNDFLSPVGGMTNIWITGGHAYGDNFGIGGFGQVAVMLPVPGQPLSYSLSQSDFKITKPLKLGDHPLVLGFDFTNVSSGGDPYNTLYNSFQFPYIPTFVGPTPAAVPAISALGVTVYGASLYAWYDNSIYVDAGLYYTWSTAVLNSMNVMPSSLGSIAGGAPYFRLAKQYTWGDNFLEIGGVWMDVPVQQVPDALTSSAQNEYVDWGLDATYQRRYGPNILAINGNILFETQRLDASFAAGTSSNLTNSLTQFRVAASYNWHDTYGLTLAYTSTTGTTDPSLFAPAPLTGSANGSPNTQAIIAQIDWTPYGKSPTDPGFPWLNVRIGLQYTHYLQFNGGTTNYDGSGRNASDNDTLLLFTWLAF